MKPAILAAALAALGLPLAGHLPARADGSITYDNTNFGPSDSDSSSSESSYPYQGQSGFVVEGRIRRADAGRDRFVVFGDNDRRYNVDTYDADIRLPRDGGDADSGDLQPGMRVRVTGRLLGVAFVEAERVRVLPSAARAIETPVDDVPAAEDPLPDPAVSVLAAPAASGTPVSFDAVVTQLGADGRHLTLLDPADARLTADTLGADIILRGTDREGQFTDLSRGLHVLVIGTQEPDGTVQADRIRVLPAPAPDSAPVSVSASPTPAPAPSAVVDLSQYSGILIDARGLPGVMRSPAPTIVGPDGSLLYPDRSHVPTPDEVQEESIVRYYHTLSEAEQGVAGPNPLILTAASVVGPASDGVQLTTDDAALFQALDKRLRFTRTWKVGFLIPGNQ